MKSEQGLRQLLLDPVESGRWDQAMSGTGNVTADDTDLRQMVDQPLVYVAMAGTLEHQARAQDELRRAVACHRQLQGLGVAGGPACWASIGHEGVRDGSRRDDCRATWNASGELARGR
ncbi:hypothetical protein PT2222_390053 [Paraburkholderia tropica]